MNDELSHEQTADLMRVLRSFRSGRGEERPVDALIAHLAEKRDWGSLLGEHRDLLDGGAGFDDLLTMKQAGKHLLNAGGDELERLAGLAKYFMSVAAALAFHRTLISSRPLEVVRCALLDLAAVSPDPYADLLAAGAAAEPARG